MEGDEAAPSPMVGGCSDGTDDANDGERGPETTVRESDALILLIDASADAQANVEQGVRCIGSDSAHA